MSLGSYSTADSIVHKIFELASNVIVKPLEAQADNYTPPVVPQSPPAGVAVALDEPPRRAVSARIARPTVKKRAGGLFLDYERPPIPVPPLPMPKRRAPVATAVTSLASSHRDSTQFDAELATELLNTIDRFMPSYGRRDVSSDVDSESTPPTCSRSVELWLCSISTSCPPDDS